MLLPPNASKQQREEFEERAAIKEYLANMPREQAEREAFNEVFLKKNSAAQGN